MYSARVVVVSDVTIVMAIDVENFIFWKYLVVVVKVYDDIFFPMKRDN